MQRNPYRNFVTQKNNDPLNDPFHPDSNHDDVHSSSHKVIDEVHDRTDAGQHSSDDIRPRSDSDENSEPHRDPEDLSERDGSEHNGDNSDDEDDLGDDCSSSDYDSDDESGSPVQPPIPSAKRKHHSPDDLAQWKSGPVARKNTKRTVGKTHRARRKNPLPYTMHPVSVTERKCDLCGPPFKVQALKDLVGKSVCSFECAKRYGNEVWYHPWGLKLNHGKVKSNQGVMARDGISCFTKSILMDLGIKYQKISLECNHSRKAKPRHNDRLPKQAQRRSQSIRDDCKARITITWPLEPRPNKPDLPYISMIRDIHTHELTPNFNAR
jgi:hypothetical protein